MSNTFHMATKENKATCNSSIKDNGENILPFAEFMKKMQNGDENYCKKCYKAFVKARW